MLNAEFLRFAAHWGFMPSSCRPYRAQSKGKVERPIRYIRESFFYGRTFANDDDLNEQAARWLEGTANVRRHATTGERPVDRYRARRAGGSGTLGEPSLLASRPRAGSGADVPYRQHPGQQLPDEGSPEPSAGQLESAPQEGCVVTAGQNGSSNGGGRPP